MDNTISKNLKRLRLSKHFTQDQAAEQLGVSTQSVSRWECGSTLPDVLMLPQIAALYCVTVDELYRDTSAAYENYARRLAAIYEASRDPDDFIRADAEFKKLIKEGCCTTEDYRLYGILHQYMMQYCIQKATEWFNRVEQADPEENEDIYWRTKHQKMLLYSQIGKGQESIDEALAKITNGSENAEDWICLIAAYRYHGEEQKAYEWFLKAIEKFPKKAVLYIYGGDACKNLGRYEDAFSHWNKAIQIDPSSDSAKYSMGFCYEELGNFQKAYDIWCEIADELKTAGYEIEAKYPMELAEKCKGKLTSA